MIEVLSIRERPDGGRLHVEFELDGRAWRCGDVPAELAGDTAGIMAHLEARSAAFTVDRHRSEYPRAVVIPAAGESEVEAWARVIADGHDDEGVPLTQCVGVL
ncbi:hypothetical protein ACI3L3_11115 [Desulfobaculum sp. SPO524]|uniref:hypothetical protein n=1 Tax=Desulfobaculum sp. SPO524 TaxID=3378071 RepID=UPI0038518851